MERKALCVCVLLSLLSIGLADFRSEKEEALIANRVLSLLGERNGQLMGRHRSSDILNGVSQKAKKEAPKKWDNALDKPLKVECNTQEGEALVRVRSRFNKKNHDRQFKFDCHQVTADGTPLTDCEWTKEINKWNKPISYMCPTNSIMTGIRSKHLDVKEDRKWKIKCCKAHDHITKSCKLTKKLNTFHSELDHKSDFTATDPGVFVGIQSLENPKNDREWKMFECNFGIPKRCPGDEVPPPPPGTNYRQPPYEPNHRYYQPRPRYYPSYRARDPYPYDIYFDTNKPKPPPTKPQPYTIHYRPNEDHINIDLPPSQYHGDSYGDHTSRPYFVQEDHTSNKATARKKDKSHRKLPVPPGSNKHIPPPPKRGIPKRRIVPPKPRNNRPPSPYHGGHSIELIPRYYDDYPQHEFTEPHSYHDYEQRYLAPPSQEHHFIPPPEVTNPQPDHLTVIHEPANDGPQIHYNVPMVPPKMKPKPAPRIHYNIPLVAPKVKPVNNVPHDRYNVPLVMPKVKPVDVVPTDNNLGVGLTKGSPSESNSVYLDLGDY